MARLDTDSKGLSLMRGSLLFFSPDGITHRIDLEYPDRRRLVTSLTDMVPLGCHIAGIILEQAAEPLSAVANTGHAGYDPAEGVAVSAGVIRCAKRLTGLVRQASHSGVMITLCHRFTAAARVPIHGGTHCYIRLPRGLAGPGKELNHMSTTHAANTASPFSEIRQISFDRTWFVIATATISATSCLIAAALVALGALS